MTRTSLALFALAILGCGDADTQDIAICGRGDRTSLASTLRGGSFSLNALDANGKIVSSKRVSADRVSKLSNALLNDAATLDVIARSSEGELVARGTTTVAGASACICLALLDESFVCEGIDCAELEDGSCSFVDASGEPPCGVIGSEPTVIDDGDACFVAGGTPEFVQGHNEGFDGDLLWTHTTSDSAVDNFARWSLHFEAPGTYKVEVFIAAIESFPDVLNTTTAATYEIVHGSQLSRVEVNQGAMTGWIELGEFEFDGNGAEQIRLGDNTGESATERVEILFDAVRISPSVGSVAP